MSIEIDKALEEYNNYIVKKLSRKRYLHSLSVSYTSAALAMRYGEDVLKAQIAGLLHDCAKGIDKDVLIEKCRKNGIEVTDADIASPELLHSKYGSFIARKDLNISDKDILNAIYYHTTGRPNMTRLEQIIFVADYIEPYRAKLPNLEDIRMLSFIDIDKAIYRICGSSIEYLEAKGATIDSITLDTYNFYLDKEVKNHGINRE